MTTQTIKIGASDVPAALGISPWKTARELAEELLGRVEPKPVNQAACNIGNRIEPFLAAEYQVKTRRLLRPSRSKRGEPGYVHPDREWLEVHPDFEADDRLVELKTVNPRLAFRGWGEDGTPDGVPFYVLAQVIAQVACHPTFDRVDVAAYFGGGDFRVFPVEPRADVVAAVLDKVDTFYNGLLTGHLPPVMENDLELLKLIYPNSYEGAATVEAGSDLSADIDEYSRLAREIKLQEARLDRLKARIQDGMGGHEALVSEDGAPLITWKVSADSKRIDWKAVCEEVKPDIEIIARHTKVAPGSRRFLCKVKTEG